MALYGTTSEQLAHIAVAARKHASMNPNAMKRTPMTIEDHQDSRWIVRPLRLLDCSLISDGGGAFIVTSAERAKTMRAQPVYIIGMGQHHPHANLAAAREIATLGGAVSSARAYKLAGLGPADMQFAELYDCFTSNTLITLEDYGFCNKGDGGAFVEDGRIEIGGELPVNTHGGLLSQGHVEGMLHITEAVKQIRREAEPSRQLPRAEVGIVSGHGGVGALHATLILAASPR
jgi:acetyl-CoA acetyltransferase